MFFPARSKYATPCANNLNSLKATIGTRVVISRPVCQHLDISFKIGYQFGIDVVDFFCRW